MLDPAALPLPFILHYWKPRGVDDLEDGVKQRDSVTLGLIHIKRGGGQKQVLDPQIILSATFWMVIFLNFRLREHFYCCPPLAHAHSNFVHIRYQTCQLPVEANVGYCDRRTVWKNCLKMSVK